MPTSLLDLFRVLSSFEPPRRSLADAPWEQYVDWSIAQGLAPLAAYNLEFRLAGADAPEWARDRLLSIYQGSINDTLMKLMSFKAAVGAITGERLLLLGVASFLESLYPQVGFRPLPEIELLAKGSGQDALLAALHEAHFREESREDTILILSDTRTQVRLLSALLPTRPEDEALFQRARPIAVYGPSVFRLDLEDAILALALAQARTGYQLPMISFVDLRELLNGAPSVNGPYSRAPNWELLKKRAASWHIERALFASVAIVGRLFPEAASAAESAKPALRPPSRNLLDRVIIAPVSTLGRTRVIRGADRLTRLLVGA